jgi:hypothetical protein
LIYIDPPFNTGRRQNRGTGTSYQDSFDDYSGFLRPRIEQAKRLLTPDGSFFLHLDYREVHYAKVLCDEVFGRKHFINEIIWAYDFGARSKRKWSAKHDNILWYAADPKNYVFNYEEIDRVPYRSKIVSAKNKAMGKPITDCYSADTYVLTEQGWKLFSDISVNDRLGTVSPTMQISYVKPTKLHAYYYNGDMILLKSKTFNLCVTPNHKLYIRTKNSKKYKFIEADKIDNYQYVNFSNNLSWRGKDIARFKLPAVCYDKKTRGKPIPEMDMGDWCELLGWWISEGSVVVYKDRYEVHIAQTKSIYKPALESLLSRICKWHYNGKSYVICNKQLTMYFKGFGKSYKKEIPREFLELSPMYLQRLYNGLMMGDGSVVGFDRFFTSSPRLADQVQELLLKLGYNSSIIVTPPNEPEHRTVGDKEVIIRYNHPKYSVYRRKSKESSVWKKHNSRVSYDGMVYCATIEPYHTLIVRRDGRPAVCGNCWWCSVINTMSKERTG